jgi:hypothetical protein
MTDTAYFDATGHYLPRQLEPPVAADEAATLLAFLDRQRATFAWKVAGLDDQALRRTLPPSSLTLGGMLKHLARFEDDMSHEWVLGKGLLPPWSEIDWRADRDWDWRTAADETPEALRARGQDAVARPRAIFVQALDTAGPDGLVRGVADEGGNPAKLRLVLLNIIEEYARHNGHADLLRESIDGLVGQDPPGAAG